MRKPQFEMRRVEEDLYRTSYPSHEEEKKEMKENYEGNLETKIHSKGERTLLVMGEYDTRDWLYQRRALGRKEVGEMA
jgi:hypothetical protein